MSRSGFSLGGDAVYPENDCEREINSTKMICLDDRQTDGSTNGPRPVAVAPSQASAATYYREADAARPVRGQGARPHAYSEPPDVARGLNTKERAPDADGSPTAPPIPFDHSGGTT